ncbi:MAG: hypothetical protein ACK55Z_32435, partial [bacterium]
RASTSHTAAAVCDVDALHQHQHDRKVCAAPPLQRDDHDIEAEENEHGLDQQQVNGGHSRELRDVREDVPAGLRVCAQRTDGDDEQKGRQREPQVVEHASAHVLPASEGHLVRHSSPKDSGAKRLRVEDQRRGHVLRHLHVD